MDFPSAILIARLQDVVMNNNVLHRLVRPTEEGTQVVSVDRLVNVVPHRRSYRFDRKDELKDFCAQLLKRPIVLQPIVHLGRGLGRGSMACGMCYKDDKWVMMVNQTHPKILSRLQIGLDAAQKAMASGQSFEITFAFSKVVEKIYRKTLTKKEQEAAASQLDLVKTYFRYAEWEHGDLILRYHGYAAMLGKGGGFKDMNTLNLKFGFEDLLHEEITWKILGAEFFPRPHLTPVTEDEIRECLPQWTINSVSPLENVGEQAPAVNYSYAQAGKLYESFRKKKRKPHIDVIEGASGGVAEQRPTISDGIELKVMGNEVEDWHGRSHHGYEDEEEEDHGFRSQYGGYGAGPDSYNPRTPNSLGAYGANAAYYDEGASNRRPVEQYPSTYPDDGFYEEKGAKPKTYKTNAQYDSHGHMFPEVRVNAEEGRDRKPSQGHGVSPSYTAPQQDAQLQSQFTRLRMQGSDRSSHSETASSGVADSGIDSDGHAREGSFDQAQSYAKLSPGSSEHPYAMLNMGFHGEEADVSEAMRKHKELVAKMMGGSGSGSLAVNSEPAVQRSYHDSRQQRLQSHSSHTSDRNTYHTNSKPGLPVPSSRGGIPSPNNVSGKQYNYTPPSSANYRHGNGEKSPSWGYQKSPQNRQPLEGSFI